MKKCILLIGIFVVANTIYAQTTGEKIEKTSKQVESAVGTINALKGLFGKKNKSADSTRGETSSAKGIFNLGNNSSKPGIYQAGTVSKNVKYIECDYLEPFNKGAAVVRKGNQYALIDAQANFIVPYGTFTAIANTTGISWGSLNGTGFFYATYRDNANNLNRCFLNSQGKIVHELGKSDIMHYRPSADDKFLLHSIKQGIMVYDYESILAIGNDGKKYTLTQTANFKRSPYEVFSDSLFIYGDKVGSTTLLGFKDLNNKVVLKPTYNNIKPFTDGVAIVTVKNDMGEYFYGAIDKKGKVLIEPVYKSPIFEFRGEISGVYYDGNFVLLKKNGDVIGKYQRGIFDNGVRKDGLFFAQKQMVDITGKTKTIDEFLQQRGINFRNSPLNISGIIIGNNPSNGPNGGWYGTRAEQVGVYVGIGKSGYRNTGVFDLKDNTLVFHQHTDVELFAKDSISGLIYYKWTSEDSKQKLEGYMNTRGEFVIIRKSI